MIRERIRPHRAHSAHSGHPHQEHGRPRNPGQHPPNKTSGYGITPAGVQNTKNFNKDLVYVQGFRQAVTTGQTVPVTVNLASPGRWLHGIAIIPKAGTDLTDCQITLVVNNNNVLFKAAASNADPGYTQGQLFFPTPQPLQGNDTITLNITNNGSGTVQTTTNFFYVPRV